MSEDRQDSVIGNEPKQKRTPEADPLGSVNSKHEIHSSWEPKPKPVDEQSDLYKLIKPNPDSVQDLREQKESKIPQTIKISSH